MCFGFMIGLLRVMTLVDLVFIPMKTDLATTLIRLICNKEGCFTNMQLASGFVFVFSNHNCPLLTFAFSEMFNCLTKRAI